MPTISDRLEQVREARGLPSVRAFWQVLTEHGKLDLTYEAARNYHGGREPPITYIVEVSQVFGADLRWLATGEGEPFGGDEPTYIGEAEALLTRVHRAIPHLATLPPHVRAQFFQTWADLEGLGTLYDAAYGQLSLRTGKALWAHLVRPFDLQGRAPTCGGEEFARYASAALAAIQLAPVVPTDRSADA